MIKRFTHKHGLCFANAVCHGSWFVLVPMHQIQMFSVGLLDSPEGLSVVDGLCVPVGIVGRTGGRDFWSLWISLLIGLLMRGITGGW